MPVIKYDGDAQDLYVIVSNFIRFEYKRTTITINGMNVSWPVCRNDILTAEVDNLPRQARERSLIADGIKACIEGIEPDEPHGARTHLPVKSVKFRSRHIEVMLDRSQVGKENFR